MHAVHGVVEVTDGDVALLTGSQVEFAQEQDPLVRASGRIESDGAFYLQTLHQGEVRDGAPEGKYQARIVLADESDEGIPKHGGTAIHRRFLDFQTSKLAFDVPSGNYKLTVSKK